MTTGNFLKWSVISSRLSEKSGNKTNLLAIAQRSTPSKSFRKNFDGAKNDVDN